MQLEAYDQLLLAWRRQLIGYLVKLGASLADAEDISQESLLTLLEYEEDLPPTKMKAWLFRVGINRYLDLYRQKKRQLEILLQDYYPLMVETLAEEETDSAALQAALAKSFPQLSLVEQTLLYLKYDEKLAITDIGFLLKRPPASVKTELYRTRKKLRNIMLQALKEEEL
ncbi:RNA polymerase sigma factor [Enterococcus nangangensis]